MKRRNERKVGKKYKEKYTKVNRHSIWDLEEEIFQTNSNMKWNKFRSNFKGNVVCRYFLTIKGADRYPKVIFDVSFESLPQYLMFFLSDLSSVFRFLLFSSPKSNHSNSKYHRTSWTLHNLFQDICIGILLQFHFLFQDRPSHRSNISRWLKLLLAIPESILSKLWCPIWYHWTCWLVFG